MTQAEAERKCALYRVVHKESGKDYVGISVDPQKRWKQHLWVSQKGGNKIKKFHCALRKYGASAFEWTIVAWCRTMEVALSLERVARHLGMGSYNLTMGGEGLCNPSEEVREKMRQRLLGRKLSEETKTRMSTSHRGKVKSLEHLAAISQALRGNSHNLGKKYNVSPSRGLWCKGKPLSEEHRAKLKAAWVIRRAR